MARELTKLHEELRRAPLAELSAHYERAGAPKGEVVIVVGAPDETEPAQDGLALDQRILEELERHPLKEAAAIVAGQLGLPRRAVYARALELKAERSK